VPAAFPPQSKLSTILIDFREVLAFVDQEF